MVAEGQFNKGDISRRGSKAHFQIPLSPGQHKDLLILRGMSSGEFSVRSAYHIYKEIQIGLRDAPQTQSIKITHLLNR